MLPGGDPLKELEPYVVKACAVGVGLAVLLLVGCSAIIGKFL